MVDNLYSKLGTDLQLGMERARAQQSCFNIMSSVKARIEFIPIFMNNIIPIGMIFDPLPSPLLCGNAPTVMPSHNTIFIWESGALSSDYNFCKTKPS